MFYTGKIFHKIKIIFEKYAFVGVFPRSFDYRRKFWKIRLPNILMVLETALVGIQRTSWSEEQIIDVGPMIKFRMDQNFGPLIHFSYIRYVTYPSLFWYSYT